MLISQVGSASAARSEALNIEMEDVLPPLDSLEMLENLTPADFGHFEDYIFDSKEKYTLLSGTGLENTVYVSVGQGDGPVIYIVGGIHGDELAGWYAGILLRQVAPRKGTVYVIAPLNQYGAEHNQRKTKDSRDINRNFPGDPQGWDAERVAGALFEDIREKNPDLVLDLHEAVDPEGNRDDLRDSIICQDIRPVDDLVLELLEVYNQRGRSLTFYNSPPLGSLNRTVTKELGIPVITLETSRNEKLSYRVERQLDVTEFILSWYDMI